MKKLFLAIAILGLFLVTTAVSTAQNVNNTSISIVDDEDPKKDGDKKTSEKTEEAESKTECTKEAKTSCCAEKKDSCKGEKK